MIAVLVILALVMIIGLRLALWFWLNAGSGRPNDHGGML